ncbi:MAG: cobalt ECF transporter T component CbiQ [Nocardioidaceae bacterium]
MGAGHGHRLHYHGHSRVHRLSAEAKVVGLVAFVIAVVATPRTAYIAYLVDALTLAVVVAASRVPPTYIVKRMVVELPFVLFAVLLPFIAMGPTVDVLGLTVSESGLEAAIALLAKATLGVVAGLTLAATTEPRDILAALEGKLPRQLVEIMAMMVRYLDVATDQLRRMRIARESRGFRPRNARHWPVVATSAGAFFVRSYERGERVHLAMLSRGYTGSLPGLTRRTTKGSEWLQGLAPAGTALLAALMVWGLG